MKVHYYQNDHQSYHVACKFEFSDPLQVQTLNNIWRVFLENLPLTLSPWLQIHSFVLMSNHYHLLVSDKKSSFWSFKERGGKNIPPYLFSGVEDLHQHVISSLSTEAVLKFNSLLIKAIDHVKGYQETYKYIYMNPVRAGLVKRAQHYPFSTLKPLLGQNNLGYIIDNMDLITNPLGLLQWLHKPSSFQEDLEVFS